MGNFGINCSLVNKFLGRFSGLFSKRKFLYFGVYVCLLFKDMKRAKLCVYTKLTGIIRGGKSPYRHPTSLYLPPHKPTDKKRRLPLDMYTESPSPFLVPLRRTAG